MENKTGRVYKLVARQSDECYISSTFNKMNFRFANHKKSYKDHKNPNKLFEFFDKYGIENIAMILIKEYEVVDKKHLHSYEQLWINRHKTSINDKQSLSCKFIDGKPYGYYKLNKKKRIVDDGCKRSRQKE